MSDLADTMLAPAAERAHRRRPGHGAGRLEAGDPHPGRSGAARRLRHRDGGSAQRDRRRQRGRAPRARSTAPINPTPSPPTTRSRPPTPTATSIITYRNGAPVFLERRRRGRRRPGEQQGRRLVSGRARRHHRHPAPARRQRDRHGPRHPAELPRLQRAIPAGVTLDRGAATAPTTIRASIHDVQFTLMLSVVLVIAGGVHVPAHGARHHHRRGGAAAVADRHLRGDVVLRLQPRQSVADGADDRHRLRGRRRHRDDREHRAPHGGRRGAVRGGARRRAARSASR